MYYIRYAQQLGANDEVIQWCNTVLKKQMGKRPSQEEVEHILDYLVSSKAPKRLRKMSYKQAREGAEKWSKANQKKGRHLVDSPADLKLIHNFGNGYTIVELLTKKAYQREGFFMAHCVGGYNPENSTIYSYRDSNNNPHATFEVSKSDGCIQQIKGKGNGPIHPKYIVPILTFLDKIGMDVRENEMRNLGYYYVPEDVKPLLEQFTDINGAGPTYHIVKDKCYVTA